MIINKVIRALVKSINFYTNGADTLEGMKMCPWMNYTTLNLWNRILLFNNKKYCITCKFILLCLGYMSRYVD